METGAEMEAPKESRVEMLNRHQKETKSLREKELEMKKAAAKGSKAEQKAKKKAVEDEIAALDAEMKEQHAKELASLGFVADENSQSGQLDVLVKAIAGVAVSGAAGAPAAAAKPSKGKKWRDKRAQKEAEREQRIQEEQNNVVSARMVEEEQLARKLQPLGLSLKEIKPDGHCLYRALEDQLSAQPGCEKHSYEQLRKIAAGYIRSHGEDFLPFIGNEGGLEEYCREIESTAAWGGQLELEALSHGLRKHIVVFSVDMGNVEMGKEYGDEPTLKLSYHKHAYGLGEHYNSVVPVEQD